MRLNKFCYNINTYYQGLEVINCYLNLKNIPILYFKYNLINKLTIDWLTELIIMLENKVGNKKFQTYVETKNNYALFINLIEKKKINYLQTTANKEMLLKLKNIAKANKVFINPNFSIIDITRSGNIKNKLKNLI